MGVKLGLAYWGRNMRWGETFDAKKDELGGEWRKLHNEVLTIRTAHQILFGRSNQKGEAVGARRTIEQKCVHKESNGKNRAETGGIY